MPSPIAPTPIVAYSGSLPDPSDPSTYGTRGRALWAWEVGDLITGINAQAETANANAIAANEAAEIATISADLAVSTAGASMWSAPTSYATGAAAISPSDFQAYRRKAPGGIDATDPAASALWEAIATVRDLSAGEFISKAGMSGGLGGIPAEPMFRSSDADGSTYVVAGPNAAGGGLLDTSGFIAKNNSTSEYIAMICNSSRALISVGKRGDVPADSIKTFAISMDNAERMRLNPSSGAYFSDADILMGSLTYPANVVSGLYTPAGVTAGGFRSHAGTSGAFTSHAWNLHWNGTNMAMWVNTTNLGNLTITSDYRVKKDVEPMAGDALARVARLRPVGYTYADNEPLGFKADGIAREGFVAHELAEVVPSAVEGEKDAPNQVQSLRLDPLVALLTKAIQELQSEVAELRQRIEKMGGL